MNYLHLRQEFQDTLWATLTQEEKALKIDVKSGEYIDLMQYIVWLEKTLIKEREEKEEKDKPIFKRTK